MFKEGVILSIAEVMDLFTFDNKYIAKFLYSSSCYFVCFWLNFKCHKHQLFQCFQTFTPSQNLIALQNIDDKDIDFNVELGYDPAAFKLYVFCD